MRLFPLDVHNLQNAMTDTVWCPAQLQFHMHICVIPTSREEPVSVLDDGLNDANNLQRHGGHHLCHVPGKNRQVIYSMITPLLV